MSKPGTTTAKEAAKGIDRPAFDVEEVRRHFPLLKTLVHGKPLIFLDSAASAQKPSCVLEALNVFYTGCYSNIHRGVYLLSETATKAYEDSREMIRRLLGAPDVDEIILLRGTTEAMNLVASSYGRAHISEGDEIVITQMEHHSNIVPWQFVCEEHGAVLRVAPIDDDGSLIMEEFEKLLGARTKLVSVVHQSNSLGTINPIKEISRLAHDVGAVVVVDGAQAVPHGGVNVQDLGCDFYAFSAHKMFGPTGVGALWGKRELLESMPPYQGGGDMIRTVSFEKTTYAELPHKFEAGTPNIAGTIGLGAAVKYLLELGLDQVAAHERELLAYGTERLQEIPELRLIGTAPRKASVLSFVLEGVHPHDVGTMLDQEGIAIRTGHHCTQPVMDHFGVEATSRASVALYNTKEELDRLADGIRKVLDFWR